jgi:hypothetical protein
MNFTEGFRTGIVGMGAGMAGLGWIPKEIKISDMEGRLALIAPQRARRGAVAPLGPSVGKERPPQDDKSYG